MHRPVGPLWRRAFVAVLTLVLAAGTALPALADLRLETELTYTPEIDRGTVHFASELTLTNLTPNQESGGQITHFYYDSLTLYVPEDVESLSITSGGRRLSHTLDAPESSDDEGLLLARIALGRRLLFQERMTLLIEYDVAGHGPRSESAFRVNPAYFSFPIIGWGDPGRVTVNLVVPHTFEVILEGSDIGEGVTADGVTTYTASDIQDVENFFIFARGWDDSALTKTELEVTGVPIVVRSWPGDDVWADQVIQSVEQGLPVLRELIGLDWTSERPLLMTESLEVNLAGYGGWYKGSESLIEIGEWVDPQLVLHELSHVWFNGALFEERWINEGLAEEFSTRAVVAAGLADEADLRSTAPPGGHRLIAGVNDWVTPDVVDELINEDDLDSYERTGYETSFWVIQEIASEIGVDAFGEVLEAAADDRIAYVGEPEPELVPGPDDWRRFLDLLEEVGRSDTAGGLFAELVTTEDLGARTEARAEYHRLLERAGGWQMPYLVRGEMSEWDFDDAIARMTEVDDLLGRRFRIEQGLETLGLAPSGSLEAAFESASTSLDDGSDLADDLLEATEEVLAVKSAVEDERGFVADIGLIGDDVDAEFRDVVGALEVEDFDGVNAEAAQVIALLDRASEVGIVRLGVAAGLLMLIAGAVWLLHRRQRRRGTADRSH